MASDSSRELLLQIAASLRHYTESLREGGVLGLPQTPQRSQEKVEESSNGERGKPRMVIAEPAPRFSSPSSPQPQPTLASRDSVRQAGDLFLSPKVQTVQTLVELRAEIGDCRRCKLCHGRTQIVFGVGDPHAELVFVGEGPGRDEDLKGEPFVGRAGQLLTEIITKGMKMRREDVYICNVVKCRPPENRNPEPDEIAACEPFLVKQLELIKPRLIVALGAFAAQTLLKTKTPISRLRGNWHTYQGTGSCRRCILRISCATQLIRKLVWQDIQVVLREMGRL
jgi:DNA polymerase